MRKTINDRGGGGAERGKVGSPGGTRGRKARRGKSWAMGGQERLRKTATWRTRDGEEKERSRTERRSSGKG